MRSNELHNEAIRIHWHCLQKQIHIQQLGGHFPISTSQERIIKILIIQIHCGTKYVNTLIVKVSRTRFK